MAGDLRVCVRDNSTKKWYSACVHDGGQYNLSDILQPKNIVRASAELEQQWSIFGTTTVSTPVATALVTARSTRPLHDGRDHDHLFDYDR